MTTSEERDDALIRGCDCCGTADLGEGGGYIVKSADPVPPGIGGISKELGQMVYILCPDCKDEIVDRHDLKLRGRECDKLKK